MEDWRRFVLKISKENSRLIVGKKSYQKKYVTWALNYAFLHEKFTLQTNFQGPSSFTRLKAKPGRLDSLFTSHFKTFHSILIFKILHLRYLIRLPNYLASARFYQEKSKSFQLSDTPILSPKNIHSTIEKTLRNLSQNFQNGHFQITRTTCIPTNIKNFFSIFKMKTKRIVNKN